MTPSTTARFNGSYAVRTHCVRDVQRLTAKEFERRINQITSEKERTELIQLLRSSGERSSKILGALAKNRNPEIRHWVADVAVEVLGAGSVHVLRDLARDRDTDVRIDALNGLVAVDPDEARRMTTTLRKQAASTDFYEAQAAVWALGAVGDKESLDVIRPLTTEPDAIPRDAAIAVELLLTAPEELCRRIEKHDHELMPWLVKAAELLGTRAARRALEHCVAEAPDEECRHWAGRALARFKCAGSESMT